MPRQPRQGFWFRTHDPADSVVHRDREAFLLAICEEAPQVLDSLRMDVLPVWRAAYTPANWSAMDSFAALAYDTTVELTATSRCLVGWARRFYIEVLWVLESAVQTLQQWLRHPDWAGKERSSRLLRWAPVALLCESVEKGGPRRRPANDAHWLVRWQVLGESAQTIAKVEDRRRRDFDAARDAYQNGSLLATPAEKEAVCDRLAKATRAVMRAKDLIELERALSNEPFRAVTSEELVAKAPQIVAHVNSAAAASLKAQPAEDRHTPWSTVDRAVREYAKRIKLPLRSHPRGRRRAKKHVT
jgi:hypothetical protein